MTTIVCTADLHEHLVEIPECDLLLIAGDVSFAVKGDLPTKQAFLIGEFTHRDCAATTSRTMASSSSD